MPRTADVRAPGRPAILGMFVDSADLGNSALFQSGGAVGLGTTAPRDVFHVAFNNGSGALTGYAVQNLSGAAGAYSGMLFYDQNGALGQFQGFNNATHEYRINNVAPGRPVRWSINFMIGSSSKFLVANNGNIGIGVPVPGSKLDVAGDINTTTHYSIGGSRVLSVAGQNSFAGLTAGALSTGSGNSFFGTNAGANNIGQQSTPSSDALLEYPTPAAATPSLVTALDKATPATRTPLSEQMPGSSTRVGFATPSSVGAPATRTKWASTTPPSASRRESTTSTPAATFTWLVQWQRHSRGQR